MAGRVPEGGVGVCPPLGDPRRSAAFVLADLAVQAVGFALAEHYLLYLAERVFVLVARKRR